MCVGLIDAVRAAVLTGQDRRTGGRLAMASMDTRAIEGEITCFGSLGLEELRREWRRLNHGEPPRISRDLLVLAPGQTPQTPTNCMTPWCGSAS